MMNKNSILNLAAISFLLATQYANAGQAGSSYAGAQYTMLTYAEPGIEMEPSALVGRFGHYLTDNFSIEARLGFGIGDDTTTFTVYDPFFGYVDVDVSLDLDTLFGVYAVGHLPLGNKASVYGLIGFTQGELTATASALGDSVSLSADESDLSYGIGAEFQLTDTATLNAEYTSFIDKEFFEVTGISLGLSVGF